MMVHFAGLDVESRLIAIRKRQLELDANQLKVTEFIEEAQFFPIRTWLWAFVVTTTLLVTGAAGSKLLFPD